MMWLLRMASPQAISWTLVLRFDPTWIGNSANVVAVKGFLTSAQVPVVPGLPGGLS